MPRPDPNFTASGFIDVLAIIPSDGKDGDSAEEIGRRGIVLMAPQPTSSYEIGHYDVQRAIEVTVPSSDSVGTERTWKTTVKNEREKEGYTSSHSERTKTTDVWGAFQRFLSDFTPVKISDYVACNQKAPKTVWGACCTAPSVQAIQKLMPEQALEATVTVQCNLHRDDTTEGPELLSKPDRELDRRKKRKILLRDIDDALTVVCRDSNRGENGIENVASHKFFGQEDQITAELPLGAVLRQQFPKDRVHVYVAQEAILTAKETELGLHIVCASDGAVSMSQLVGRTRDSSSSISEARDGGHAAPLAALAPGVVSPSLLLPSEKVRINDVNFWFAPQNSCTNYHYDCSHNILCVVHGRKTVELAPPGAIKGSAIFSEHANHPATLRPSYLESTSKSALDNELQSTKLCLNAATTTASISAGEALYIPAGWWHRVESNGPCMAVNFWFDQLGSSLESQAGSVQKHMLPFHAREVTRRYFNEHFDNWAADYTRSKLHALIANREVDVPVSCLLDDITVDGVEKTGASQTVKQHILQLSRGACKDDQSSSYVVSRIAHLLTVFLLSVDLKKEEHRLSVIKMFEDCFSQPAGASAHRPLLAKVILGLDLAACFVITRIWEKQGELGGSKEREAEASYTQFFVHCGEKEAAVKSYLQQQVGQFKRLATEQLVINDLILGISEDGKMS